MRRVCSRWARPLAAPRGASRHRSTATSPVESLRGRLCTHHCAELTAKHVGEHVTLSGWVSSLRRVGNDFFFIALRDGRGTTQLHVKETPEIAAKLEANFGKSALPLESVISVKGRVLRRPEDQVNRDMATGEIEVDVEAIEVHNVATELPFGFHRQQIAVSDDLLLKYRYLDLRQPLLQHNIRLRSKVSKAARDYLHDRAFTEIETPTLFKSTPEGAREFLVATRLPGKFYCLPQSPQQYKQLLMVGGFERYFQFARCYRDETGRKDRQPEFTQIDMEFSFVRQEDVMEVIEGLIKKMWEAAGFPVQTPFLRMKHKDAMENYGTDRPDTRFGFHLINVTKALRSTKCSLFANALKSEKASVVAINFKNCNKSYKKNDQNDFKAEAEAAGAKGAVLVNVDADGKWHSPIISHLSQEEVSELKRLLNVEAGDLLVFGADEHRTALKAMGRIRTHYATVLASRGALEFNDRQFNFMWVVDFPLFARADETSVVSAPGSLVAEHHPFTAPRPEDIPLMDTDPEAVTAQHYDIVVNGIEIGGGSIRIHQPEMQLKVLRDIMKLSPERLKTFDHLITALGHGAPPHGGIALGFDRIIAILTQSPTLKSTIAFPKTGTGAELMTGSPSFVEPKQLAEVYLSVTGDTATKQDL